MEAMKPTPTPTIRIPMRAKMIVKAGTHSNIDAMAEVTNSESERPRKTTGSAMSRSGMKDISKPFIPGSSFATMK